MVIRVLFSIFVSALAATNNSNSELSSQFKVEFGQDLVEFEGQNDIAIHLTGNNRGPRISGPEMMKAKFCSTIQVTLKNGTAFAMYATSGEPADRTKDKWDELDIELINTLKPGQIWANYFHDGIEQKPSKIIPLQNGFQSVPGHRYCLSWDLTGTKQAIWTVDDHVVKAIDVSGWTKPLFPVFSYWAGGDWRWMGNRTEKGYLKAVAKDVLYTDQFDSKPVTLSPTTLPDDITSTFSATSTHVTMAALTTTSTAMLNASTSTAIHSTSSTLIHSAIVNSTTSTAIHTSTVTAIHTSTVTAILTTAASHSSASINSTTSTTSTPLIRLTTAKASITPSTYSTNSSSTIASTQPSILPAMNNSTTSSILYSTKTNTTSSHQAERTNMQVYSSATTTAVAQNETITKAHLKTTTERAYASIITPSITKSVEPLTTSLNTATNATTSSVSLYNATTTTIATSKETPSSTNDSVEVTETTLHSIAYASGTTATLESMVVETQKPKHKLRCRRKKRNGANLYSAKSLI